MKVSYPLSCALVCLVIVSSITPIMEVKSTLNPSWVVPTGSVTIADVQDFRERTATWLFRSLFFANSSSELRGRWLPYTFFESATSTWKNADRENAGFFYDFYVTDAFLETGNQTYARWLKGWADNFMSERQSTPHYEAAVLLGLISSYQYYYNRNNATLRTAIESRIQSLIANFQNPNTGLWANSGARETQGMKKSYALRALVKWYEITRDPTLLSRINLTIDFWVTHQTVYGGQYWWHQYNWTTGQAFDVPSTGMYANFHDIQQGLDGVAYAASLLGREDFKAAYKKYLDWWIQKGIDSEGRIWATYTADQRPNSVHAQGGANGYIGALLYHLSLGYTWLGDSAYVEAGRRVFHTMTKWMTYHSSIENYRFGYAKVYDPNTDNPTDTSATQVNGYSTNYAYNGLTSFIKAITKNVQWRRGSAHVFNIADNTSGNFTQRREGPYSITIDGQYINGTYSFDNSELTIRTWANASLSAALYVNASHNGAPAAVLVDGQAQTVQFSPNNSTVKIALTFTGTTRIVTVQWGSAPNVSISKISDRSLTHVGETISYTIVVTDDGQTSADLTLTDPDFAEPAVFSLTPGQSTTFSTSHVVQAGEPDPIVSTATVSGTDELGRTIQRSAESTVDVLHPRIIMRVTVSPSDDLTQVTYVVVLRNPTSDTPLQDITVNSLNFGQIEFRPSLAAFSEIQLAPFTTQVSFPLSDSITVRARDPSGLEVSSTFQIAVSIS